jgi:hypothetical protein
MIIIKRINDFTKGTLRFPFEYRPRITYNYKVWDVYNNPTTVEIQFLVVSDEGITLTNVLNYPNPFQLYRILVHAQQTIWAARSSSSSPNNNWKNSLVENQLVTTDGFFVKRNRLGR